MSKLDILTSKSEVRRRWIRLQNLYFKSKWDIGTVDRFINLKRNLFLSEESCYLYYAKNEYDKIHKLFIKYPNLCKLDLNKYKLSINACHPKLNFVRYP